VLRPAAAAAVGSIGKSLGVTAWEHPEIERWEQLGAYHLLAGHEVFVVDLPARGGERGEPLLVIHGYPTSSFDFAGIAGVLAAERRVVLVDLLGFGLSSKPDLAYTMALQADVVVALTEELSLERLAMLTHDMGDTVGGELLARQAEGSWPVEVTRRVVTNGSIYIAMAQLTAGQQLLLSLPDARLDDSSAPTREALAIALAATLAPAQRGIDMGAHAELVVHRGGNRLLARTIRYVEERRANERRFTGAIESHPSPLTIVWGPEDPIAVAPMADRLREVRPGAALHWIAGAGHYPQLEDPAGYVAALEAALG
jgi:pimeloyl-ACP methyl ester carboxylesterase